MAGICKNDGSDERENGKKQSFNAAFFIIGMGAGVAIGVAIGNIAIGIGVGAGVGIVLGVAAGIIKK